MCDLLRPGFLPRARMRLVVDLREMLKVQMRVNLCRGNARVPHEFLHCAQIAGALQDVRREGVAQSMWVHVGRDALL